jgi:hypothetical protein
MGEPFFPREFLTGAGEPAPTQISCPEITKGPNNAQTHEPNFLTADRTDIFADSECLKAGATCQILVWHLASSAKSLARPIQEHKIRMAASVVVPGETSTSGRRFRRFGVDFVPGVCIILADP